MKEKSTLNRRKTDTKRTSSNEAKTIFEHILHINLYRIHNPQLKYVYINKRNSNSTRMFHIWIYIYFFVFLWFIIFGWWWRLSRFKNSIWILRISYLIYKLYIDMWILKNEIFEKYPQAHQVTYLKTFTNNSIETYKIWIQRKLMNTYRKIPTQLITPCIQTCGPVFNQDLQWKSSESAKFIVAAHAGWVICLNKHTEGFTFHPPLSPYLQAPVF